MQHTRQTRITANLVGMMLFVQVILGGSTTILGYPNINYHIAWGTLTLIVLITTMALARRDFGTSSNLFKVAVVAIVDFLVQIILGLIALGSNVAVVIHLTNAFTLAVLVTYLISFADSADKAATVHLQSGTMTSGKMPG